MAKLNITADTLEALWHRNTSSFAWHVINLARQFRLEMLNHLALEKGFKKLSLSYTAIVGMVAGKPMRPSELAEFLGISKQHCFAMLEEIENAGYLRREEDPSDKRAKRVVLTVKGEHLISDALEIDAAISHSYQSILGTVKFNQLTEFISAMYAKLDVPRVHGAQAALDTAKTSALNGLILGVLADDFEKQTLLALQERGYKKLKAMHYQIINYLGVGGVRVSELAEVHGISSQAIGQAVKELEALHFVQRCQDQQDARSKIIVFTEKGIRLLQDCVEVVELLQHSVMQTIGAKLFKKGNNILLELTSVVVPVKVRSVTRSGRVAIYRAGRGLVELSPEQNAVGIEQLLIYLLTLAAEDDGIAGSTAKLLEDKQGVLRFSDKGIRLLQNASIDPHHINSVLRSQIGRRELSRLENAFSSTVEKLGQ